jgi:RNA polymerase sigma-70 factor, ECF subfamily
MRPVVAITFSDAEQAADVPVSSLPSERMDEAAFRALYEEAAPKLRAYIRRSCGDAALADDVLQETFYRFLRADLPVLEKHQMKGYLYRTASSLLADHWRRLKRERRWSLESFFRRERAAQIPAEMDPGTGPDSSAMRLFARLKPQERDLLWLAYVEGFDHREIAAALHFAEKSVRVLLFRARQKLARLLQKENIGPGDF